MKKLIRVTLLALLASLLTAFYLSMVQATYIAPKEMKLPDTQPDEIEILNKRTK